MSLSTHQNTTQHNTRAATTHPNELKLYTSMSEENSEDALHARSGYFTASRGLFLIRRVGQISDVSLSAVLPWEYGNENWRTRSY